MDRPVNIALGWRLPSRLLDWGPPAFVLLIALASNWRRPTPVEPWTDVIPVLLVVVAALAFRHRWPEGSLAVVLAGGLLTGYKSIGLLPILLGTFNLVEYAPRPRIVVGVVASTAVIELAPLVHGVPSTFAGLVSRVVAIGLAVAVALYLRARTDYILGLRDRAARLERERELLAEQAVTEERVRIARELHDVVAHNVSLMVVQAQALAATGPGGDQQLGALARIGELGREAMSEMHRMLGVLRVQDGDAAERAPQPGVGDLPALVARTRETGLEAKLEVLGDPRELSPGVELSIYRIAQEALTNVIRHAGARQATVALSYRPDAIELTVLDDGTGPADGVADQETVPAAGHGLVGMRERVALFGGELSVGPRGDGHRGCRVRAILPGA